MASSRLTPSVVPSVEWYVHSVTLIAHFTLASHYLICVKFGRCLYKCMVSHLQGEADDSLLRLAKNDSIVAK